VARYSRLFFVGLFCLLPLRTAVATPEENSPREGRSENLYQGKVEHSRKLPALPPAMRSGATLADDAFDTDSKAVEPTWFAMPGWLSGTWSRPGGGKLVREENLVTGAKIETPEASTIQFIGNEVCGYQMDPSGTIWHCLLFPYKRVFFDADGTKTLAIVTSADVVAADDSHLVIKRMSIRLTADRRGAITKSQRSEDYTEYLPVGPDAARTESSIQFFDQNGKPVLLHKTSNMLSKIAGFEKCDFWPHDKTVDLRPFFDKFLYSARPGAPKILKYDTTAAPTPETNSRSDFEN
jgi:hypothetical protein